MYDHCFYEFDEAPPFQMRRSSPRFMFNTSDRIHFVAGMYRRRDSLVISYGASDRYAMETEIPIARALELLAAPTGAGKQRGSTLHHPT